MIRILIALWLVLACPVWAGESAADSAKDQNDPLVQLRIDEYALSRRMDSLQLEHKRFQQLEEEIRSSTDSSADNTSTLAERLAFTKLGQSITESREAIVQRQLEFLDYRRQVWTRLQTLNTHPLGPDEYRMWTNKLNSWQGTLKEEKILVDVRQEVTKTDLEAFQERLGDQKIFMSGYKWTQNSRDLLKELLADYDSYLEKIDLTQKLIVRFKEACDNHRIRLTVWQKVKKSWSGFQSIWDFEIVRVDNHPISIGKVILAFLLFIFGIILSRVLSRMLFLMLRLRTRLGVGGADAVYKLMFYSFVVVFSLLAFRIVQVPLTIFAFLGGALALGVGFGSQNIVNNFISGLIMLVERPIKLGDYVEVDGVLGEIDHIGMRSTRVKTPDNIHLVIPNSSFLEKNVTNWTLSDHIIRAEVSVGVAYGSPTDQVQEVMMKVVEEHESILKYPQPLVLFVDFGDNALQFQVFFWLRVSRLIDRKKIQSELRFAIDQEFRQRNIVIAFPQRDVHVDMAAPLTVRLLSDAMPGGGGAQ